MSMRFVQVACMFRGKHKDEAFKNLAYTLRHSAGFVLGAMRAVGCIEDVMYEFGKWVEVLQRSRLGCLLVTAGISPDIRFVASCFADQNSCKR